jgi:hypothetical protein
VDLTNYQELTISKEQEQFIEEGLKLLSDIIKENKLDQNGEITPKSLDGIYPILKKGTWWSKKRRENAILILGVGLGYCFVRELGYKWIYVKDSLGEELSVKHEESNWTSFPFSSVRKRIRTGEKNFFSAIIDSFGKEIKNGNVG